MTHRKSRSKRVDKSKAEVVDKQVELAEIAKHINVEEQVKLKYPGAEMLNSLFGFATYAVYVRKKRKFRPSDDIPECINDEERQNKRDYEERMEEGL